LIFLQLSLTVTARRYACVVYAATLCCPSTCVCLSQAGILR